MSAEIPSRPVESTSQPAGGGHVSWGPVIAVVASGILFLVLLRWAIDVLLFLSTLLLLAHSTRDTLQDWLARESFEGEPDPVWALGAVSAGVFGTVIAGLWLFAGSDTGARFADRYAPMVVNRAIAVGERHGWGRRTFWPRPARVAETRTAASETTQAASVQSFAGGAPRSAGTSGAAEPGRAAPVSTLRESVRSDITLAVSATSVSPGTPVTLRAAVTASVRPAGTVVFRRGTTEIGAAPLDAEGRASLIAADLPPGTHDVSAQFLGSPALKGSRSATVRITVG
jgi:hypothetical protein